MDINKIIQTAKDCGIEVTLVPEGEGGFYIDLPDGTERKLTTEEIMDILLNPRA